MCAWRRMFCRTGVGAVALALAATAEALPTSTTPAREEIDLGFGWRFAAGPLKGAMRPDYPDGEPKHKWSARSWYTVDLPHDFQFAYPWDRNALSSRGFKAMGSGWYRQRVFADPAWRGKRVALDFGGVLCRSEVYLNGDKVAEDDYGYLGFEVDVSEETRRLKEQG